MPFNKSFMLILIVILISGCVALNKKTSHLNSNASVTSKLCELNNLESCNKSEIKEIFHRDSSCDRDFYYKCLKSNDYKASQEVSWIDVRFATDRMTVGNLPRQAFYNHSIFTSKRGEISYGVVTVSIPKNHTTGKLETASIWKAEMIDTPNKHITFSRLFKLDKENFFDSISSVNRDANDVLIFVHGYNTNFKDAVRRTAQLAYDLEFKGVPILYSWPSNDASSKYTHDENNVEWTQPNLQHFLAEVLSREGVSNVYLIAHSMGSRALTGAYVNLLQSNLPNKEKIKEVILAAPDIDAQIFERDIAPIMHKGGSSVTLYASKNDLPLKASKAIHSDYPRAGDSEKIVITQGVETIDASYVNSSFLGHSYFSDERSIISDMYYLVNGGLRANERAGLKQIDTLRGSYWEFKR